MKWKRLGFLGHYRRVRIEGNNLTGLINRCLKGGITLRRLKWHNSLESSFEHREDDSERIKAIAGHTYRITVVKEGGIVPALRLAKANVGVIVGAFLIGALIFYQGLFVAEIRIGGYEGISETEIRETLAASGLYEGARKPESYDQAKKALFDSFEKITWVGIYERGRLIEVDIAEADRVYKNDSGAAGNNRSSQAGSEAPAHIIAAKSGIIEKILPLQGNACVEKGDYVNKGDMLISGRYDYQSTDYSRGDKMFKMYSHAKGQVLAKVPDSRIYYMEKKVRTLEPTGSFLPGIYFRLGDFEIDTCDGYTRFDVSCKEYKQLVKITVPLPLEIDYTKIREVDVYEKLRQRAEMEAVAAAAVRQYEKTALRGQERILDAEFAIHERKNTVRVSAMLEVLEEIGQEKKIIMKKNDKKAAEETN